MTERTDRLHALKKNQTLLIVLIFAIANLTMVGMFVHQGDVSDYNDCVDRRDGFAVLADVVTTAYEGGGTIDFTQVPEYQDLSPEDQAMWRAFGAIISGASEADDINPQAVRLLERIPVTTCTKPSLIPGLG